MIQLQSSNRKNQMTALYSQLGLRGLSVVHLLMVAVLLGNFVLNNSVLEGQTTKKQQSVSAVIGSRGEATCFIVKGLIDVPQAKIQVWLAQSNVESDPPMMGSTSIEGDELVFTPRFPVKRGAKFVVHVQSDPKSKLIRFQLETRPNAESKTSVIGFFPSADRLPENTLRFYIHFSGPMQKGDIYRFIRLRDVDGLEVELPFLEIEQEFWSRDSRRLTLLLDPGRIKRGLKPREEMGPILVEGKTYELIIDEQWSDANGQPLGQDYKKRFLVGPEDNHQPDPSEWKITPPKIDGEKQLDPSPLSVEFPDPLDHGMLFRVIRVIGPDSNQVNGVVTVSREERVWTFQPDQHWKSGTYKIVVSQELEDNAGNSIGRKFDVDVFDETESPESTPSVELVFKVSSR